jgi:hypothetical protein
MEICRQLRDQQYRYPNVAVNLRFRGEVAVNLDVYRPAPKYENVYL